MTGGNRSGGTGVIGLPTASAVYDPPNIVVSSQATTTVAVPGAVIGDFALASFSISSPGLTITAYVSSADLVTVVLFNGTASDVNLASGTLRVKVFKQ